MHPIETTSRSRDACVDEWLAKAVLLVQFDSSCSSMIALVKDKMKSLVGLIIILYLGTFEFYEYLIATAHLFRSVSRQIMASGSTSEEMHVVPCPLTTTVPGTRSHASMVAVGIVDEIAGNRIR